MSRLHANQRRARRRELVDRSWKLSKWSRAVLVGIVVLLAASACTDNTDDRQFASDPRTSEPTPAAEVPDVLTGTPRAPAHPLASPETLVDRRGAPSVVYAEIAGSSRAITTDGVNRLTDGPVAAFAASPSGNQVAVVVPSATGLAYDVKIYASDGTLLQRIDTVLISSPPATPADQALSEDEAVALSWSPQGGRLLLADVSGQLIDIRLDGTVEQIQTRSSLSGLIQAEWSPRGDQIGVLFRDDDGYGSLALIDLSIDPASVDVIAPVGLVSGEPASVESFAWNPYGDGVLFLQGNPPDDGVRNGQVVGWNQASNTTEVIATGGQVGPTGSIRQFSIAPDGKALAYAIDIRTPEGSDFGGLYVRSLVQPQVYRVPVKPNVTVTGFWWVADGLAWAGVVEAEGKAQTLVVRWIDGSRRIRTLAEIRMATMATPVAAPMPGAPAATPVPITAVASFATPVAVPAEGATPVE
ncbi:MAG TPA: hypothetical protein VGR22_12345 [Thermomicrobiales bacterium]|nr:hypothetical protein [Thermomicrobiales bacterium]